MCSTSLLCSNHFLVPSLVPPFPGGILLSHQNSDTQAQRVNPPNTHSIGRHYMLSFQSLGC